jgi:hypothetical protein
VFKVKEAEMTNERGLAGLTWYGDGVIKGGALLNGNTIAVATSEEALGTELFDDFCATDYPNAPNKPGDELINVVVGDPHLLKGVKIVDRGNFNVISLPNDVRDILSMSVDIHNDTEIIVFENQDGSLVYIDANQTTLLENVEHLIDEELLAVV